MAGIVAGGAVVGGTAVGLGGAALVVLALYGVIDAIVMLFFNGALYIAQAIMSESIITFTGNDDIITKFTGLIPFADGVMSLIEGFAYGILILSIVVSVLKTITSPITGEPADNPLNILGRVVFAIVARYAIFGFNTSLTSWSTTGLIGMFGRWFGTILGEVQTPGEIATNYMSAWGCNPFAYIGYLILAAALIGSVITAAVSYIERIIAFGLSAMVGPVAISMMASRETSSIAKEWIMSIFTQFGAIMLNLALWTAFVNKISQFEIFSAVGDELTGDLILDIAIAIAILSMIKNCEQIFNSFGLRTIPNSDTAKSIVGGIAAVSSGAAMAARSIPQVREGFSKLTHGSQPAIGGAAGGAGHRGGVGIGTGTASFYDKNGNMSAGGIGNAARRGLANVMTAGVIAPQQDRQMTAIGNIGKAVNGATPGQRYGGFTETGKNGVPKTDKNGNPVFHTGVEAANMAIGGGKKEGSGIRFQSSASGVMGEALSPGTLRSQGHASPGIYSSEGGNNPSDSLLVGSAVSPTGQEVKGFVGSAAKVNSDGTTTPMGNVFIPTSGANEPLAIGSRVDVGGGEGEGLRIKSAFNVDESGHLGYTTEPIANQATGGEFVERSPDAGAPAGTPAGGNVSGGSSGGYSTAPVGGGESFVGGGSEYAPSGEYGSAPVGGGDAFAGGGQILGAENLEGADDYDPTYYTGVPNAPVGAYDYDTHPEKYDNPGSYAGGYQSFDTNPSGNGYSQEFSQPDVSMPYAGESPVQNEGQFSPSSVPQASDFGVSPQPSYEQPSFDGSAYAESGYMPDTSIPESMAGGFFEEAGYSAPSGNMQAPSMDYSGGYNAPEPMAYEQQAGAAEMPQTSYEPQGGGYESAPMAYEPQSGSYEAPSMTYEPQPSGYEAQAPYIEAPQIDIPQAEAPIIQNQGGYMQTPEPMTQEGSYTENNSFQNSGNNYYENSGSYESSSQNYSETNNSEVNSFAGVAEGYDLFAEENPEQHKKRRRRRHK